MQQFPWVITVKAADNERKVSSRDVLDQIHEFFMEYVGRSELESQSDEFRHRVEENFWKNRTLDCSKHQLGPGIRRYDLLGDKTVFIGLVPEDRPPVLEEVRRHGDRDDIPVYQMVLGARGWSG